MNLTIDILSFINSHSEKDFEPYYLYDINIIRQNCRKFQNIPYQNKEIHFASMANVNPNFLQIVKEEKVKVFVNSTMHLQSVQQAGFRKSEIIFTSSALSEKTMKFVESCEVQINLDSLKQLELWQKLFPEKSGGIRVNIGDEVKPFSTRAGFFIGKESRLGFNMQDINMIKDKSKIKGLHLYVGTDVFDINYFIDCYKELIKIASFFPNLEYLNFGGGFGVSENGKQKFDFPEYYLRVTNLMNEVSEKYGKSMKLIVEPGRIIGGEAGYFVCNVTDIKRRENKRLIGLNASTVQFTRPLIYPGTAKHPAIIIRNGNILDSQQKYNSTVYGCSTYSRDIFSEAVNLPELEIGDIIVFGIAGSYLASSYCQFLGFPKPDEYFL